MIVHIELHNIPEQLDPGDSIECTVAGEPYAATFLRYGEDANGNRWKRKIWVEIPGLTEVKGGKLSIGAQLDMFNDPPPPFRDEFFVNHSPGKHWHRSACGGYEQ